MARRHDRVGYNLVCVGVVVGLICGFFLGTWSRNFVAPCLGSKFSEGCCLGEFLKSRPNRGNPYDANDEDVAVVDFVAEEGVEESGSKKSNEGRKLLFIGVMTAKKYLHSRVVAAHQTWANSDNIPGKTMFFSSAGSEEIGPPGIPIVGLPGVDDSYPPQKKSFLMLKYMYDNYGDQYEWFMRADDDVFIRGDKLVKFLHSVNSSKAQFIGQAGLGTKEEFGQLYLDKNENFCMGGPGIFFSRITLEKVASHISYCLKNLYTTHEDVELGRCVQKFAQVSCSWAFEMQHLFCHNHNEPNGSFSGQLKVKEVHRALTLHPIKNHTYQYRLLNYFQSRKSLDLRQHTLLLHREINAMDEILQDRDAFYSPNRLGIAPSLVKFVPKLRDEVISWEYFNKAVYSDVSANPKRGLEEGQKVAFDDIIMQVMQMINKNARQRGRTIDFKEILYGYKRVNPLYGADYILDLLLVYRKHKGRKMTVPVRRHAYLQQTFFDVEFLEETIQPKHSSAPYDKPPSLRTTTKPMALLDLFHNKINGFPFYNAAEKPAVAERHLVDNSAESIHFLLPLAGRYQTFLQFMKNFEEVCLEHSERVVLAVMLFQSIEADRTSDTIDYIRILQTRFPQHDLRVVQLKGPFSRALALDEGSLLFPPNTLLVFIDVDIYMNRGALERIRWNAIQHKQVYYPIVFSQYDPQSNCTKSWCKERTSPFNYHNDVGYWRKFGFGIAAMYNSDLKAVGGFDTTIRGWGKEDVDLYNRFVTSHIQIIRAVDPSLVHIYHPISCDPNLESAQYQMCLGSKSASFGSRDQLARMVLNTPELLNKDSQTADDHKGADSQSRLPADDTKVQGAVRL